MRASRAALVSQIKSSSRASRCCASSAAFSTAGCSCAVGSTMARMLRTGFTPLSSVAKVAVVAQFGAVANRTAQPRQVIGDRRHFVGIEAVEKAHQVRVDVESMRCSQAAHLAHEIGVVLVAQRRDEAVIVAARILLVAGGALLLEDGFAELHAFAVGSLGKPNDGKLAEIASEIRPLLRLVECSLRDDGVHGITIALQLREIGELLDQIRFALSRQSRNDVARIADRT